MEKRRRARINQCLDELKSLILEAMQKDPARHAKLEKADILEMTVKHLQDMQRTQMRSAVASDPSVLTKFHSGFKECATEVTRYVSAIDGVDEGVKRRLLGHLTGCMTGLNQVLPLAAVAQPSSNSPGDENNNTGATGRLQLLTPQDHRSAFTAVQQRNTPPVSPVLSDSSDSCQELRVHISERPPLPEFNNQRREEGLLMEVPRPSTSSVGDMWRPW